MARPLQEHRNDLKHSQRERALRGHTQRPATALNRPLRGTPSDHRFVVRTTYNGSMLLYRLGPEGFYAATDEEGQLRVLFSDPFEVPAGGWEYGRIVESGPLGVLPPVHPGKIVGIGRNYRAHAEELGNPVPEEPVIFLKAPTSIIGPGGTIVLPPESERVEFEGEIAVIIRRQLCRASRKEAVRAILGITCACDVTARDLQRKDPTFARGKSFDTFCPLGPGILVEPQLDALEVITRVNGSERQRGRTDRMLFDIPELLSYTSRMMTLEPGDIVLTGTPEGVGPLADGDQLEVEVSGVGVLANPVEVWRQK
jgi:2-keto-4-pentenoate hydratase/2-oxohepta-3-ene-1,7-dioic acid hydratase in catechol pathway